MTQLLLPIGYNDPIALTNRLPQPTYSNQSAFVPLLLWLLLPIICECP